MRTDVTIALALLAAALGCSGEQTPPPPPPAPTVGLEDLGTFAVPVYLTAPSADHARVFVVEKRGTIQVVTLATKQQEEFLDLRGEVSTGSEQGLLGLAFHPNYATNGLFVIDYTDVDGDSRIVQYRVSASDPDRADPASARLVLTVDQPFANHNGGMVLFGPDGRLYIGFGDGGSAGDPLGNGQRLSTLLGKILRVDLTGGQITAPTDNPFVGQSNARPEIWSYGLRNPWRFSFDRQTGDLYLADVGQAQREEIDVVTAPGGRGKGVNFGWNRMEGTACFNSS